MNLVSIKITQEQKRLIRGKCREAFIRDNPKFKGFFMSDNFIIQKMIDYYIEE